MKALRDQVFGSGWPVICRAREEGKKNLYGVWFVFLQERVWIPSWGWLDCNKKKIMDDLNQCFVLCSHDQVWETLTQESLTNHFGVFCHVFFLHVDGWKFDYSLAGVIAHHQPVKQQHSLFFPWLHLLHQINSKVSKMSVCPLIMLRFMKIKSTISSVTLETVERNE